MPLLTLHYLLQMYYRGVTSVLQHCWFGDWKST